VLALPDVVGRDRDDGEADLVPVAGRAQRSRRHTRPRLLMPGTADPLTPAQRQAVDLRDRGYGIRRIAHILGISPSAVRDRLEAAARKHAIHDTKTQHD
jgi:predicted DNA binding protein